MSSPEPEDIATASPSVATAGPGPAIATVNLKLPPFWSSDPEVWFQQVEALFRTRHVTAQHTKFDHVVASLSPEFATEVRDLIIRPPADAPYDSLREQLIKRTTASEQRKLTAAVQCRRVGRHRQHIPAGALLEASPWQCPHDPGLYCQLEQFG